MEKHKLDRRSLKYCPTCKIYFPNAFKKCATCKKALKSFFLKYYLVGPFKKALFPLIILLLFVCGTYGIQVNERGKYISGFNLLRNKQFAAGWEEIIDALARNPLYKYAKSLTVHIKGKVRQVRKEQYTLREIYFNVNSKKNSAFINNKIVFEGDNMDDFKVIKINIDSIDIETDGKQRNIKFGSTWN
ncbi:MAG: hypothetical protein PHT50_08065 [Candidatus Omnitrophica bacterium]|nr:hypothetical protein [Candidatus Omnitrophota bacterium]